MKRWCGTARLATACILFAPVAAHAHLVTTGIGPVYDGIVHLFVSFEDLLAVIAIALLAGLKGPRAGRWMLFSLPLAWLLGGVAGTFVPSSPLTAGPAAVSLLVIGALAAADFKLAPAVVTALTVVLGLVHGWQNGAALVAAGAAATVLVGTVAAVFAVAALVAALVIALRRPWNRIAVRVACSWIAASGMLLLGWTLSGRN
jgi:hydrogenase/urease accessory protein HupE